MVKLQDFCKFLNFLVLIGGGETGLLPDQVSTELSHKITKNGVHYQYSQLYYPARMWKRRFSLETLSKTYFC